MGTVRLEGYLEVPPDRIAQVLAALPTHIGLTLSEPGCLGFEVTQSPSAPERFLVREVFVDQSAFEQHQARTEASVWAEVTAGLERHYTITTDSAPHAQPGAAAARFAVPERLRHCAIAQGDAGQAWLDGLNDVLIGLETDWNITIGPARDSGIAAFLAEATTAGGDKVLLKVSTPAADDAGREAAILDHAAGKGYPRLLHHEPNHHAMLLEQLGDPLESLDLPYVQQIDIICATLLQAWGPVPAEIACTTGADKANGLAQSILSSWYATGRPCAQAVLDTALMYCRDRAAAYRPENAVLAHGNPGPDIILAVPQSDPVRFKFIAPQGLAIEPAYDLGVLLRSWHEGISGRHAHDIARSHARHLTGRTQVPSEAIWQWGYIERVSTGLHLIERDMVEQGRVFLDVADAIAGTAG